MKKYALFVILLLMIPCLQVNAVNTSATSAILMEQESHRILYSKNIHKVRSIASISKYNYIGMNKKI